VQRNVETNVYEDTVAGRLVLQTRYPLGSHFRFRSRWTLPLPVSFSRQLAIKYRWRWHHRAVVVSCLGIRQPPGRRV